EVRRDARDFGLGQRGRTVLQMRPLGLDLLGEGGRTHRFDEDLDARLVHVVASAEAVVDAQDGLAIGQDVAPRHEGGDLLADDRRAPQATADEYAETEFAGPVAHQVQPDVVRLDYRAVVLGAIDGDLELARQEGEL